MENLDIFDLGLLDFNSANSTKAIQYQWKLKEKIDPEFLQKALDKVLEQFPYFKKTIINKVHCNFVWDFYKEIVLSQLIKFKKSNS